MKKHLLFVAAVCTALLASADPNDPQVRLVSATMDSSRNLNIKYMLDEPAIVTFDVKTNGVSIGAANLKNAFRDVYRVVPATGGSHTIILPATEALPDSITRRKRAVTVTVTAWATNSPPDYLVIKLVGEDKGARTFYTAPEWLPGEGGVTNDMYKTDYLVMRRIPAAGKTFRMGSPSTEAYRYSNEILHYVSLTNDYYMTVFNLTQGQFRNITLNFPGFAENGIDDTTSITRWEYKPTFPVEQYACSVMRGTEKQWPGDGHEVAATSTLALFRNALGLSTLDLPTEAEWEFACRAGTLSAYYNGTNGSEKIAWTGSSDVPHAVGLLEPNAYGIYDMCGNVFEWCLDRFSENHAETGSTVIAPVGPESGNGRVVRGCEPRWTNGNGNDRSAYRFRNGSSAQGLGMSDTYYYDGYRLVCTF